MPVTNASVRQALVSGTEDDKIFWIAKIMREARYDDVWKYVSLRRDVLPRWAQIEPHLGRWRDKWRFLIQSWKERGLNKLSELQVDLVEAFFAEPSAFFLTGGAALAGYYLGHRFTEDLDLFSRPQIGLGSGVLGAFVNTSRGPLLAAARACLVDALQLLG